MSDSMNPDFIMLRKSRADKQHDRPISHEVLEAMFQPQENTECLIYPYVALHDLNNQTPQDIKDCNPPKSSLVIGIKGTF